MTLDTKALEAALLPCPFCGETDRLMASDRTCDQTSPYNPADFAYPRVICRCGVEVGGKNWSGKETAIEAWNRRATPSRNDILEEAARGMVAAWESLPEGYYSQDTMQKWIVSDLKPAIDGVRRALVKP